MPSTEHAVRAADAGMSTDPAPRSRVDGLLEEGRRLQALAEKAAAYKTAPGCCEGGFRLSILGQCRECMAGPDDTCRRRWDKPPALLQAALEKDAMPLIRSLCEALGEAQDKIEQLRLISNVNGDWTMIVSNLRDELAAERQRAEGLRPHAELYTELRSLRATLAYIEGELIVAKPLDKSGSWVSSMHANILARVRAALEQKP